MVEPKNWLEVHLGDDHLVGWFSHIDGSRVPAGKMITFTRTRSAPHGLVAATTFALSMRQIMISACELELCPDIFKLKGIPPYANVHEDQMRLAHICRWPFLNVDLETLEWLFDEDCFVPFPLEETTEPIKTTGRLLTDALFHPRLDKILS